MQSPNNKLHNITVDQNAHEWQITPELWLCLATVPFMLGVLGGKAIAESLQAIGQASEEVLRGDRLPVLHFPAQEPASSP